MPGLGERGTRLRILAQQLAEPPEIVTYYHVPPRHVRQGPGWYMGNSYQELHYIGYSAAAAEVNLLQQLGEQEKEAAKR
ncbi:MAG TPA: hypothetical protein VFI17_03455 [Solirubrobacterales bacterium]|nr:hypothetical protein [Solirubrobacterales bacterium]